MLLLASVVGRRDAAVDAESRSSPTRRSTTSPLDVATDTSVLRPQRPVATMPMYTERWSPSRPIPAIPQCFVCGYRFSSAEALGEHNETVHSIFTCLCCFKTFTSRSNLERHSRLHTGHRPYACPVCGKTFSRKDHLSNHATKHAYKCGTCTRRCSDRSSLAEHYRLEHPGLALAAVCAYCNKGFSSLDLYEEHVKVHPQYHVAAGGEDQTSTIGTTPVVRHQCQMCGFEAMDRVCLVQHQQLMHYTPMSLLRDAYNTSPSLQRLDQRQIYRCVVCGFTAASLLALRQHEVIHVYDMSTIAACHQTSYSIPDHARTSPALPLTNENSDDQKDLVMVDAEGYACQHCGQQFDTYASLCQHIQDLSACTLPGDVETLLVGGSQYRDKRKQKQPKPTMTATEDEDEVVNVVSPDSLDEDRKTDGELRAAVDDVELRHSSSPLVNDAACGEIRIEPIRRSIMNRTVGIPLTKVRERASPLLPPPLLHLQDEYVTKSSETGSIEDVAAGAASRSLLKRRNSTGGVDIGGVVDVANASSSSLQHDVSNHSVTDLASESAFASRRSSTDELSTTVHNNNNNDDCDDDSISVSVKTERQWLSSSSSSMLEQTRCVVCGSACTDFAELESHCLSEHSRSPCMYCPKTFAQKANRDRHMCLHTGDRPYGCPECGERFSRGDKLKMHRVRTHGVLYPLYGTRGGSSSQRDRDGPVSSQNHSTTSASQSLMMTLDCSTEPGTIYNGSTATSQDSDCLPQSVMDSEPAVDLHGSASVLSSAGEWIDLRISSCRRESTSKLQSALAGVTTAASQPLETFPKRETGLTTDEELALGAHQVHGSM